MAAGTEILTIGLGGEIFAVEAAIVREILDLAPVTEVPTADPFAGGLINVRGKVVPLVDVRLRFGMVPAPPTIDTRMVVIEIELGGAPCWVAMLADRVFEVTEMAPAAIEETPRIGMRWRPEYIRCIGKRGSDFIIVLDIDRVVGNVDP